MIQYLRNGKSIIHRICIQYSRCIHFPFMQLCLKINQTVELKFKSQKSGKSIKTTKEKKTHTWHLWNEEDDNSQHGDPNLQQ